MYCNIPNDSGMAHYGSKWMDRQMDGEKNDL